MAVAVKKAQLDVSSIAPFASRQKMTYSDPDELKRRVDAFMLEFDVREAELKRKMKDKIVDEDGFELVKPSASSNSLTVDTDNSLRKKRKSSSGGLDDFYKFQVKERKMAEWGDMKKQEYSDRSRLEDMKAQKKFQL